MPDESGHIPVLPDEVLALLDPKPGDIVVDCTVGRGGHASLIVEKLHPGGRYIAFDLDQANLDFARRRLHNAAVPVDLVHGSFADSGQHLRELGIDRVDALLADLGFASNQMDDAARGFSFDSDGPLDMRLDTSAGRTAGDLVNELPESELADLIYDLGEERLSRKIARKIVETRKKCPIKTTAALAQLVRSAYGPAGRKSRIDPATRTFMALRIAVNGELDALDDLLEALPNLLKPGGRVAIISFHSLEDRRVKHAFNDLAADEKAERLTRKPVVAGELERMNNPRSRSAKLRAIRFKDAS